MDPQAKFKVAVIPFVHVGHMNPLLAMVKELVDRGVEVVFFGDSSVKQFILKAGARYISIYDGCFDDEEISAEDYFTAWRQKEALSFETFPSVQSAGGVAIYGSSDAKLEGRKA